jgi:predicted flap endonuclease-1-like 5' DNA nuclease
MTSSFLCNYWWLPLLLLPLLGLAAGWAIWGKYKSMMADLNATIDELNKKIKGLELNLSTCKSRTADLEGDLALAKGRLREAESASIKVAKLSGSDASSAVAGFAAGVASSSSEASNSDKFAWLTQDNLQAIEGIGPKMESVLKENGVGTFSDLAAKSPEELRDMLDKYGDNYKIIDPTSWPKQAELASKGEFESLINIQKQLDTGVAVGVATDSKLEKLMLKAIGIKSFKKDDLKAVEGIGPKIEELLHNASIGTWKELSETSTAKIQEILDAAGPNYQLADPSTWPKQAELAGEGKWTELKEYQDFLQGGS